MKTSDNQRNFGINIGSTSLVMIFSVLCLVIFALMSVITVNNEKKLAEKSAYNVTQYYEADYKATEILNIIKNDGLDNTVSIEGVLIEVVRDNDVVKASYNVPVSEKQELNVAIKLKDDKIKIEKWQCNDIISDEIDEHLNVWDGDINDIS